MVWVFAVVVQDSYHWIDSLWLDADGAAERADRIKRSAEATHAKLVVYRARFRLEDAALKGEEQVCTPKLTIVRSARVSSDQ